MGELLKNVRALLVGAVALLGGGAAALVASTNAAATATPSSIKGNQTIAEGQTLASPDGHFQLTLRSGDLVELVSPGGRAVWATDTSGAGNTAVLQSNGDLVVKAANGNVLWSSNASGGGCPSLDLQNDGQLVVYGPSAPIWSNSRDVSGLYPGETLTSGQALYSQNYLYELLMRPDGALAVLNDSDQQIWGSGTRGNDGAHAQMLSDGNLVVESAASKQLWSSGTGDSAGAHADVTPAGNLIVDSRAGKVQWSSDSSGHAGTGKPFDPAGVKGSAAPCPTPTPTKPAPVTNTVTTVVTTVQSSTVYEAPPAKKGKLSVKVGVDWHYLRDVTRLRGLRFGPFPHGSVVSAVFQEPHKRRHIVKGYSKHTMAHLVHWAEEIIYHPGDIFELAINRRGDSEEKMEFIARGAELPACRPSCTVRR